MLKSQYTNDVLLAVHFLAGIACGLFPQLAFYWTLVYFGLATFQIFIRGKSAYTYAAYLVGLELLMRMSRSGIPHEFTKYAVSLLLILELIRKPKSIPLAIIGFVFLLIPSALLSDGGSLEETRQLLSANLSGPFCLAISVAYFFNRLFTSDDLKKVVLHILFPLAAIIGYLFIKTPDLSEVEFGTTSNFQTSIYGPNQMSSILGLGIVLIGVCYLLRIKLTGSYLTVAALVFLLAFRGLLTFSRGGMLTSLITMAIIALFLSWKTIFNQRTFVRMIMYSVVLGIIFWLTFQYANKLTDNALFNRYAGIKENEQVEDIDEITSGRTKIIVIDWNIFLDHPLTGVGVGMARNLRKVYGYGSRVAAHNEFSRLLAEHGILGAMALIILIGLPVQRFFQSRNNFYKAIILMGIGFSFVFMMHSATRIAAPGFLYGLAFVSLVSKQALMQRVRSVLKVKPTQPVVQVN